MTARELASILRAKKSGKDRWRSKCPAHRGDGPSLVIAEGRKGIVLKCQSQGCSTKEILDAMGLKWNDLFRSDQSAELKGRLANERKLEKLGARRTCLLFLLGWDRENASYWEAGLQRIAGEMEPLYWEVMPDQDKFEKVRGFELNDYHNKRLDWLRANNPQGLPAPALPSGQGPNRAGVSATPAPGEVRHKRLHEAPPQLQAGRL